MSFWQQIKNNTSPAVLNLVIVNGLMWLATLTFPVLNNYLGLHYFTSERFNFAQLVTYMFMHGNFAHVFFNMFAVYMFGVVLERVWGTKRFLLFYFVTGIGAGLVQELVWAIEYQPMLSVLANGDLSALPSIKGKLYHFFTISNIEWLTSAQMMDMGRQITNSLVTIGASGAVFGILLAFGWLFPDVELMMLFFPIPIRARIFVIIYAVAELFLGMADFRYDNVAHFAHLGGMLFGVILILIWKKQKKLY